MTIKQLIDEGIELQRAGRSLEARARYEQALLEQPAHPSALHLLGLTYLDQPDWELGTRLIKRAISKRPGEALFHYNLGVGYRNHGDFTAAERCFRDALELKPDYGEAWAALAATRKYPDGEQELTAILSQIEKAGERLNLHYLHFAAGKILDDLGEFDRAFEHFKSGNALAPGDWNPERYRASCTAIRAASPQSFFMERRRWGCFDVAPIFVVGMPRSGSSLVEQILSSHPDVAGVGEIPNIKIISRLLGERQHPAMSYPASLESATEESLAGYASTYLEQVSALAGAPGFRTVDKALNSFLFIPVIRLMFPRARIIHCKRHPLATGLSCFMQNFAHSGSEAFSLRLDWIREYFLGYRELMDHWREVVPGSIVDVEYEQLVNAPEEATRAMLMACDLEWNEDCLEFASTQRRVGTASAWQVRQPLYTSSLDRWRNYQQHLEPLKELLAYAPSR